MKLSLTERLLHSTVRLTCTKSDGSVSCGTGFFYRILKDGDMMVPLIMTNKHVVKDAILGQFCFTESSADATPMHQNHLNFEADFASRWINHPDPDVDLCCMNITPELELLSAQGMQPFIVYLDNKVLPDDTFVKDLLALEEVIMDCQPQIGQKL